MESDVFHFLIILGIEVQSRKIRSTNMKGRLDFRILEKGVERVFLREKKVFITIQKK
jgi:hypothetical protein